ncbi:MAG TPA: serine hydrolase domain-containing protein [Verrucomicrobiae bacterium]|nr:serine hydrolase domain-containing protein [Verrucomicrobiae bacterium]
MSLWLILGAIAVNTRAEPLPRSTPEEQGISSAAILDFVEAADQRADAMHSFMLVRHGKVVAEGWWSPYNPESRHELYSLSKSFTSTAVGLAVSEGKLSLDDPVLKFFPGDAPENPSANLKAMRIRDLLRMATGHQTEPALRGSNASPVWTKTFLAHSVPNKPGTHFLYNTAGTYMQSAIVQKVTGMTVLDYLRPRLFEPLGIESPTWGTSPQGISFGGYGLNIRTEDIARFGQLYLQKGQWNGQQLVPATWVREATSLQTSNGSNPQSDWDQGYGYQFWRCRHGIYRGDGAFGQYCIVMPDQNAVLAITSGTRDMQNVLNIVWDRLLPFFGTETLPPNDAAKNQLKERLASLSLPAQRGASSPNNSNAIAGKKYIFPPNDQKLEAIALDPGNAGTPPTLVLECNGLEQRLACGNGTWIKSHLAYGTQPDQPVATSGAWTEDGAFKAKFCFYETPFMVSATLKFSADQVTYDSEYNVTFGQAKKPQLVGHAR